MEGTHPRVSRASGMSGRRRTGIVLRQGKCTLGILAGWRDGLGELMHGAFGWVAVVLVRWVCVLPLRRRPQHQMVQIGEA